ncbi:MAG: hypothetical protein AAB692_03370, partial [Patescibacteria group bacterium]
AQLFIAGNPAHQEQQIRQLSLVPGDCQGENCIEVGDNANGISVEVGNARSNGGTSAPPVPVQAGQRVFLKFYMYADDNQMPIKRMLVDKGDGQPVARVGLFRNHRGLYRRTNPAGLADLCGSGQTWGLQPAACETGFIRQEVHYECNLASLPSCDGKPANDFGACKRGGKCYYKPKVQILDNWDICNGICPDASNEHLAGNKCIQGDPEDPSRGECGDNNTVYGFSAQSAKQPWSFFPGWIEVSPKQ